MTRPAARCESSTPARAPHPVPLSTRAPTPTRASTGAAFLSLLSPQRSPTLPNALWSAAVCVAWEEGNWQLVQVLPRQSSAILWLQRLRSAALDSAKRWSAGQREALDAGCEAHGKELAEGHKHVLQELPYPKFIQLYYQCSTLPRPPASP